jgi:hypothetical protein
MRLENGCQGVILLNWKDKQKASPVVRRGFFMLERRGGVKKHPCEKCVWAKRISKEVLFCPFFSCAKDIVQDSVERVRNHKITVENR